MNQNTFLMSFNKNEIFTITNLPLGGNKIYFNFLSTRNNFIYRSNYILLQYFYLNILEHLQLWF